MVGVFVLVLFVRFPKIKAAKGTKGNKPNSCAVRSQKKQHFQKEREHLSQLFLRTRSDPNITADPNKKPSETWSFEVRREIPSGCSAGRSVQGNCYWLPWTQAPKDSQTKILHQLIGFDTVYPSTQVLPLPIIHIQLVQIPHLTVSWLASPLGCENSSPGSPRGRADSLVTWFQVPKKPFPRSVEPGDYASPLRNCFQAPL